MKPNSKNNVISISKSVFERLDRQLKAIQSQADIIAKLTNENNLRILKKETIEKEFQRIIKPPKNL